ncbi:hypothetical protein C8A06_0564 [Microbacteriaceae bacterium MWH-Ta3]|nr:hypothetical protein C8A06_0564 [Microbacteriaceae bacterium MWH-Ta3]
MIHRTRIAAVFVVLTGIWKTAMFWGLFAFPSLPYQKVDCFPALTDAVYPNDRESVGSGVNAEALGSVVPGTVCGSSALELGTGFESPYIHTIHPEYSGLFVVAAVIVAAFATWMFTRFRREPARAIAVFVAGFIAQIGAMVALTVWDAARIAQEYGADCVTWVLPPSAFGQFPASELVVISSGCSANAFYKGILMISLDPTPAAIIAGVALAIAVVLAWKGTHRIVGANTYAA